MDNISEIFQIRSNSSSLILCSLCNGKLIYGLIYFFIITQFVLGLTEIIVGSLAHHQVGNLDNDDNKLTPYMISHGSFGLVSGFLVWKLLIHKNKNNEQQPNDNTNNTSKTKGYIIFTTLVIMLISLFIIPLIGLSILEKDSSPAYDLAYSVGIFNLILSCIFFSIMMISIIKGCLLCSELQIDESDVNQ